MALNEQSKSGRYCIIESCGRPLKAGRRLPVCERCASSMNYWDRRKMAQILDYRERLSLYTNRTAYLVREDMTHVRALPKKEQSEFATREIQTRGLVRITNRLVLDKRRAK